jgi:branched-chain amino acid transport system ATP-binding protein
VAKERRSTQLVGIDVAHVYAITFGFGAACVAVVAYLLIDEVMAGLNPAKIAEIAPMIRRVRDQGVTILMIEHVMQAVMDLSDRAYVLNNGAIIVSGTPGEIVGNPAVIEAYLGAGMARRLAEAGNA